MLRGAEDQRGSFLLSSLDVFCCGFGGAIFLFLILSSVKSEPPELALRVSPLQFLVGQWNVSSTDLHDAALRVQLQTPDGKVVSLCDARQGHPCTYRVTPGAWFEIGQIAVRAHFGSSSLVLMVAAPEDEAIDGYEIRLRCDLCQSHSMLTGWYDYKGDGPTQMSCQLSIGQYASVFPVGETSGDLACALP